MQDARMKNQLTLVHTGNPTKYFVSEPTIFWKGPRPEQECWAQYGSSVRSLLAEGAAPLLLSSGHLFQVRQNRQFVLRIIGKTRCEVFKD